MKVIGQAQKLAKLLQIGWNRPVSYSSSLTRVHPNASLGNNVAQILDLWLCPVALGLLGIQLLFTHYSEDQAEVVQVFLTCLREDQDVIQITDDELVNVWSEGPVHNSLERCRGVRQAKAQNSVLKSDQKECEMQSWGYPTQQCGSDYTPAEGQLS